LNLPDVVRDPRDQLARRPPGKERGRLIQDVTEEPVAQRHHDALAHVGHQVGRPIAAETLEEIRQDDLPRHRHHMLGAYREDEDLVEDRLDQPGQVRRSGGVHHHRDKRHGQPAPVGRGHAQEPAQLGHARI
jgi:hypothetical protein